VFILLFKYCLLITFLILVSIKDIKTREISDHCQIAIAALALIGFNPILSFTGLLCALPFMIVAVLNKGKGIGGADIKFMMAIGFVLGLSKGLVAGIIGLLAFVLFSSIKDFKKEKMCYPMIPFLSLGVIWVIL
jgi:leader peptidase (prepilin peptidase)/N-methyltransferase